MAETTDIRTILRQEIAREGVIPFSRFMEMALYCPEIGYYEKGPGRIGRAGDYFTSVSVGSLFGELLAFQFAQWLELHGDKQVQLVEAGAHDGQLALDILESFARETPNFWERFEYWIIEPSKDRQRWQQRRLDKFAGQIRWWEKIEALSPVTGVIFSNELLDAMPVRRYGWDAEAKEWFEWGVEVAPAGFSWATMPADSEYVRRRFGNYGVRITSELEAVLPNGFTLELSLAAGAWWHSAAKALKKGKLMTFDYGFWGQQFVVPERVDGTVRAYSAHRTNDSVLANPGEQDITAHVNFTQLQIEGERAGLKTEAFASQQTFLTRIAEQMWKGKQPPKPEQVRQFQTLTHPEHLGERFRVLVQAK